MTLTARQIRQDRLIVEMLSGMSDTAFSLISLDAINHKGYELVPSGRLGRRLFRLTFDLWSGKQQAKNAII